MRIMRISEVCYSPDGEGGLATGKHMPDKDGFCNVCGVLMDRPTAPEADASIPITTCLGSYHIDKSSQRHNHCRLCGEGLTSVDAGAGYHPCGAG